MSASPLKQSLLAAVALLAGLGLGWAAVAAMREPTTPPATGPASTARQAPNIPARDSAAGATHDFHSLKRRWDRAKTLPDEVSQAIERMDAPELKELLLALRKEAQDNGTTERSKRMGEEMMRELLRDAAVAELYHRDAEDSLKWAEALGAEGSILVEQLLRIAAKEEPAFARSWIDRLRPSKGEQWAKQFCATAWQGSAARSAADMLEVEKLYEGQLGSFSFRPEEIADNFDFKRYVKEAASPISLSEITKFWAAGDPDAAFESVTERAAAQGNAGSLFGAIFQGMATMKGDAAAAQWIAGKVDTLPEERRAEAIGWLLPSGNGNDERLTILMEALRRDQDRMALAKSAIDPFGMNPMSEQVCIRALGYLKADQQAATLKSAAENYRQLMASDPRSGQRVQEGFERIMAKLALGEDEKARVRAGYAPN